MCIRDSGKTVQSYGYKICYSDSFQGNAVAKAAMDKGFKKVIVYADNSSDYAKGLTKVFTTKFKELGGTIVGTENYQKGDKDFTSILTKIKNKDFDAIFVPCLLYTSKKGKNLRLPLRNPCVGIVRTSTNYLKTIVRTIMWYSMKCH